MNEVEGKKVTENVEGKVSEETSQTVPGTDSQEDVIKPGLTSISPLEQQKEADEEKSQEALRERIANLQREIAERMLLEAMSLPYRRQTMLKQPQLKKLILMGMDKIQHPPVRLLKCCHCMAI